MAPKPSPSALKQPRGYPDRTGGYRPRVDSVREMGSEMAVVNSRESSVVNSLLPLLNPT